MKNKKKKYQKSICEHILAFFTLDSPHWHIINMPQTLERRRKYIGAILSNEHTPLQWHLL